MTWWDFQGWGVLCWTDLLFFLKGEAAPLKLQICQVVKSSDHLPEDAFSSEQSRDFRDGGLMPT